MSAATLRAHLLLFYPSLLLACFALCLTPAHAGGRATPYGGRPRAQPPTATHLTFSPDPSQYGQSVTFTAVVTGHNLTGAVQFTVDSAVVGSTAMLSPDRINATLTTSTLSIGSHTITAAYSGDANNAASTSNAVSEVVTKAVPTTALTSSTNPSPFGTPVTFMATVTTAVSGMTGTVTFKDGAATLGSAPFTMFGFNGGGETATSISAIATLTTAALTVGAHTISATYSGDSNFASSASMTLTQTVTPRIAVQIALTSSANVARLGETVVFTAAALGSAGPPTGTVQFQADGVNLGSGVSLNPSGPSSTVTTAMFPATLAVGAHTVTAVYGGDGTYASATSRGLAERVGGVLHTFAPGFQWIAVTEDYRGVGLAAAWDAAAGQPQLVGPPPYQSVAPSLFAPGQAYLFDLIQPTSLYDTGVPVHGPFTLSLAPGWNMISDPFSTSVPLADLRVSDGGTTDSLTAAAQHGILSQVFWGADGVPHYPGGLSSNTLDPYQGYWVNSLTDCQLIFTVVTP